MHFESSTFQKPGSFSGHPQTGNIPFLAPMGLHSHDHPPHRSRLTCLACVPGCLSSSNNSSRGWGLLSLFLFLHSLSCHTLLHSYTLLHANTRHHKQINLMQSHTHTHTHTDFRAHLVHLGDPAPSEWLCARHERPSHSLFRRLSQRPHQQHWYMLLLMSCCCGGV